MVAEVGKVLDPSEEPESLSLFGSLEELLAALGGGGHTLLLEDLRAALGVGTLHDDGVAAKLLSLRWALDANTELGKARKGGSVDRREVALHVELDGFVAPPLLEARQDREANG